MNLSALVEPDRVHRSVYTDPAIFDAEMEHIWEKTWVYCGHESQVPKVGDYWTLQIGRHLLPGFMSHLIASATLSIPSMILAETALSFLGLGLRPPITSWGVLLNEATDINVVAVNWWLMFPTVPVILVILAYQFMGDGMRDAADPYG